MLCKNCEKEIGNERACSFCGYDPVLDEATEERRVAEVSVPPVEIRIEKRKNGIAIAGFVTSFFSWYPVLLIVSFIFNVKGFFKAKYCHSGRGLAIFGLIFNILPYASVATVFLLTVTLFDANVVLDIINALLQLTA